MANDTVYGLAAYIAGPVEDARPVTRRAARGRGDLNYPDWGCAIYAFGYRQSATAANMPIGASMTSAAVRASSVTANNADFTREIQGRDFAR